MLVLALHGPAAAANGEEVNLRVAPAIADAYDPAATFDRRQAASRDWVPPVAPRDRVGRLSRGATLKSWSLSSAANEAMAERHRLGLDQNGFDVGGHESTFNYRSDTLDASVAAGPVELDYDSLVISDARRRGVSATGAVAGDRLSAQLFSLSATPDTGGDDPFGLAAASGHIRGAGVQLEPMPTALGEFGVSALYYSGKTGDETAASASRGESWSGSLGGRMLDRRLDVSAELSQSRLMTADATEDVGAGSDAGMGLKAGYDLVRQEHIAGRPLKVGINGGVERLGSDFASMANPDVASDRLSTYGGADITWGDLSTTLAMREDNSNVDARTDRATDRIRSVTADGRYSFGQDNPLVAGRPWLGRPFVSFGLGAAAGVRLQSPALVGAEADDRIGTRHGYLGAGTRFDHWGWQVRQEWGESAALAVDSGAGDETTELTDVAIDWSPSRRLSLSGGGQWRAVAPVDSESTGVMSGRLALKAALVPKRVRLTLDYAADLPVEGADQPGCHHVSGELGWQLRQANHARGGIELALRGTGDVQTGNADIDDNYGIYAVVRLSPPMRPSRVRAGAREL